MRAFPSRVLVALPLVLAACSAEAPLPAAPAAAAPFASPLATKADPAPAVGLLACPSDVSVSGSTVIGRAGGTLAVEGYVLEVPAGAVPKETVFQISAPASDVLELHITADKRKDYKFKAPVTVRVSYARCADATLPEGPLAAWWIDESTRSKLGELPSSDDRAARVLTFETDHLSGYAIAYRNGGGEEGEQR